MNKQIKQIEKTTNLKEVNGNYKCKCPYHDDSGDGSLIINLEQNKFHCFGCGEDGTIEDLLSKLKENAR